jgi:tripartite-type tricarboxylate transporter receptor subunit TctC
MLDRRSALSAALIAASAVASGGAWAQAFPSRTVTFIVPFPPGGATDQLARVLAQKMTDSTGAPVVVENRPGGGAQIAAGALKLAPADGYTVLFGDIGAFAINRTLYSNLSYDALKDFEPVTQLMTMPMLLLVPQGHPAQSPQELIALAKSKPGGLTYASQGVGTGGHLLGEMFKSATGAALTHVPYKGGAPAMQDLVAGRVDLLFEGIGAALPFVKDGKVKALAQAAPRRAPQLADLATTAELGLPGVSMQVWFGAVVRAGTPEPAVRKLNEELVKGLNSPDVAKRLTDQGFVPGPTSPQVFGTFMREETERWGAVVKASGARVE